MSGDLQRLLARVLALGSAYAAVSLLERMAAAAEADAAAARLAAAAADEALFAHLTGPCGGTAATCRHPYERSPHSGAGNCWCGRHEGSPLHAGRAD